ncbi:hypothetical protein EGN72_00200, partial [Pseudorhodobacter sp. E13]|uniref:hypothetical protein n=1 Tax=Pseudorhodobacter sp. E13 TaxID=2487931 RepID=UPI000F93AE29
IGLGQSLCAGVSSANSLMSTVTPYPDDALMFDLATGVADVRMGIQTGSTSLVAVDPANLIGFKPLTAVNFENTRGETPLESCAFAVVEQARALGVRMRTLAFFA